MVPERIDVDRVMLGWNDANALVSGQDIDVGLSPGSGPSLSQDWWSARVDSLDIEHTGYGVDDTLVELTRKVRGAVRERLAEGDYDQASLPVILRLWMADQEQRLRTVLEEEARLYDPDYEDCAKSLTADAGASP
jgi:hypothetical protein